VLLYFPFDVVLHLCRLEPHLFGLGLEGERCDQTRRTPEFSYDAKHVQGTPPCGIRK
jgi:hypothetical protein